MLNNSDNIHIHQDHFVPLLKALRTCCASLQSLQGCSKEFTSVMDRRKHLLDLHAYPSKYAFDRLHLGKKKGQQRPSAEFQKGRRQKAVSQGTAKGTANLASDEDKVSESKHNPSLRHESAHLLSLECVSLTSQGSTLVKLACTQTQHP